MLLTSQFHCNITISLVVKELRGTPSLYTQVLKSLHSKSQVITKEAIGKISINHVFLRFLNRRNKVKSRDNRWKTFVKEYLFNRGCALSLMLLY